MKLKIYTYLQIYTNLIINPIKNSNNDFIITISCTFTENIGDWKKDK